WPTLGLAAALTVIPAREFEQAATHLLASLEPLRQPFRRPDGRELTHTLRVRRGACPKCEWQVYLHPDPMVSVASRSAAESDAYYGCRACGSTRAGSKDRPPRSCPACGSVEEAAEERGAF